MMKKYLLPLFLGVSLSACSGGFFGEAERPPLPGERISVLESQGSLRPDPAAEIAPAVIPDQTANPVWAQSGGTPARGLGNLALSSQELKRIWSADIGDGSKSRLPLTTQPIVAGNSIFTLDTDAVLTAFSTEDGKRRWSTKVRKTGEKDPVISGGIAFDNGLIYVTAGYDEILAVDAASGAIKWRSPTAAPSRAAPTIAGGRIYITTLGNTLQALDGNTGEVVWEFSGLGQTTGLIGAASPAFAQDLVIPAFTSGELYALRALNGTAAWSDNLAGGSLRLGGMTTLADIRGLPVINENAVYAISIGGRMVSVDLISGTRNWQREISGSKTPWVAGNRVYLLTNNSEIVALEKSSGAVAWVSQLARYKDAAAKTGNIFWTGPVLAGGRLLAFSSDGRGAEINPAQGTLVRQWSTGKDIRLSPVVAGGTLYLLAEDGTLMAYR